ncbi:hypothetical protein FEM03_13005 [Phragmitibacter flavus]|uniref:Transporter n=1 Tax=Phragmitibacter flavus TaxID=2576071 RepID=A0A5R8KCT4_9BACT|nr:hypothetical protein [Phragmitibacter flavus]TLD70112.1 hypothetical protein FEM03_13005 [Phragmitibacter flavus]
MKTKFDNLYAGLLFGSLFLCPQIQAGNPVTYSDKTPASVATEAASWKENTITPVANPVFFEDAIIRSEIRPFFAYHRIDDSFVTGGGHAEVYAVQLRYAITDRLAFIATKDGYMDLNTPGIGDSEGWLDIAAGLKYALIDDEANAFILTPGFTFEIPLGNSEVFQGEGSGEWNPFISAQKGFGNFHLQTNIGVRIPNDSDAKSTILHYSLQADYYLHRCFIPFVAANGYTVVSEGNKLPIDSEGYDVINFGSSQADGTTQITIGAGFRSRLTSHIDFGIAYEKAAATPKGLFDDRITVDFSIRF